MNGLVGGPLLAEDLVSGPLSLLPPPLKSGPAVHTENAATERAKSQRQCKAVVASWLHSRLTVYDLHKTLACPSAVRNLVA